MRHKTPPLLTLIALLAVAAMALAACSSSAATAAPTPESSVAGATATPSAMTAESPSPTAAPSGTLGLAGLWGGTWKDTSPDTAGGSFQVTFTQAGNLLAGSIVVKGTPCLTTGTVTGSLNGNTISFGAVSGQVKVTYDGSVSGTTMQGTYSAPACGDAKGNWTATKS